MDGTLADSYTAITASVNHLRTLHGMPPLEEAVVRAHVGRGLACLLTEVLPGTDLTRNQALFRDHHAKVIHAHTHLLPGAREAVVELKKAGYRIGVCTNKNVAFSHDLLDFLGLTPYLDVVLGPEDVPHLKPAPDMLLAALRRLGVAAGETLYVGDMAVDIQTARAAGVTVWVVPTGSADRATLVAAGPDRILDSLAQVPQLLHAAR